MARCLMVAVLKAINAAVGDGATLLTGSGEKLRVEGIEGGYYVAPTVLADVPKDSAGWRDEIFGPVLALASFDTEAEAVSLANDSQYGLGHAVMSADVARCERVAAQLQASRYVRYVRFVRQLQASLRCRQRRQRGAILARSRRSPPERGPDPCNCCRVTAVV